MNALPRYHWSPERDAVLRNRIAAGVVPAEIAGELGVTEKAVYTRMSRLGLRSISKLSHNVRDAIRHRHEQGWRQSRIALQVGVEIHVVVAVLGAAQ